MKSSELPLAIYTVITGNYDTINQPQLITPGADYYLFTNNPSITDAGVWKVVYLDESVSDSTKEPNNVAEQDKVIEPNQDYERVKIILLSRKVKMLAHRYLASGYEGSIYLDADMLIKSDLGELFGLLNGEALMAAFRHSYCNSVRGEIDDLMSRRVVEQEVVKRQWERYCKWGFRDDIGVTENGILIRKHNHPRVVELMELWWKEFKDGCLRDQVSLMPCVFKCGFMPHLRFIERNVRRNEWVDVREHL